MARGNTLQPTAANIISSLGVKGAIPAIPQGASGSSYGGFIPVLNEDGKVDLSFIPAGAAEMSVQRLTNAVVVDPGTTATVRTGSVIAPFANIAEAAASIEPDPGRDYASRCTILLMPGKYDDSSVAFSSSPVQAFVIGVGECVLGSSTVAFSGIQSGGSLTIQNLVTNGNVSASACSTVTCLGVTRVYGSLSLPQGSSLILSSESFAASTNASSVSYLSGASRVGNSSAVTGATVGAALDTLGGRAVRVADMTYDDDGFHYDLPDDYTDVAAIPSGAIEVYDLRLRDKTFADGINRLVAMWRNPTVGTLTADTVRAGAVEADEIRTSAFRIGGYKLTVDAHGYLVVVDGDEPVNPPFDVVVIRDSLTHETYTLGIAGGRMYVAPDDASGEPSEAVDSITVEDPTTGEEYDVVMYGGRLVLSEDSGSGSDEPVRRSALYAMDESTGMCYRVVASVDGETGEVGLTVDQQGVGPYI